MIIIVLLYISYKGPVQIENYVFHRTEYDIYCWINLVRYTPGVYAMLCIRKPSYTVNYGQDPADHDYHTSFSSKRPAKLAK